MFRSCQPISLLLNEVLPVSLDTVYCISIAKHQENLKVFAFKALCTHYTKYLP